MSSLRTIQVISEIIKRIKGSFGSERDEILKSVKENFQMESDEKWVVTQLRMILFKMWFLWEFPVDSAPILWQVK